MACGEITVGSAYNCATPLQGGTKPKLILFNYEDIDTITEASGVITAITLAATKTGFLFEGFKNSNVPSSEKISSPSGQAMFKHQVQFFIYENTQAAKQNIEKLANGKFMAIIENNPADLNRFELLGKGCGLEMIDGALNNKNENNGAYTITLATGEGQGEAKLPQTIYLTSVAATKTLVEGLY
jgi:hypothetical protein